MAAAFGLLGIVAAMSGQNLQIILQSPYAIGAVAMLFVVLASSMFDLFELQLPATWVARMTGVQAGPRGSLLGASGMGFLSALIVGPCVTAPLAAALLYIAHTGDVYLGAARSEEHTSELQSRDNLVCRLQLLKIDHIN